MNTKEFENSKKEIEEKIFKNCDQIKENERRSRLLGLESPIYKILMNVILGLLPSVLLLTLLTAISLFFTSNPFLNFNIPAYFMTPATFASSLLVGNIMRKKVIGEKDLKKKIGKFSKAKTQLELLEEETYYILENKKLENRNEAMELAIEELEFNKSKFNSISGKFDFNNIILPQTESQTKNKVKNISLCLEQAYNRLDILTTKKFLIDDNKSKFDKLFFRYLILLTSGIVVMCYNIAPLVIFEASYGGLVNSLTVILGISVTNKLIQKFDKDSKNVFDNINRSLGDECLTDTHELDKLTEMSNEIDDMIEKQISEIKDIEIQLQEQKAILSIFEDGEKKKSDKLNESLQELNIIDNEVENNSLNNEFDTGDLNKVSAKQKRLGKRLF